MGHDSIHLVPSTVVEMVMRGNARYDLNSVRLCSRFDFGNVVWIYSCGRQSGLVDEQIRVVVFANRDWDDLHGAELGTYAGKHTEMTAADHG